MTQWERCSSARQSFSRRLIIVRDQPGLVRGRTVSFYFTVAIKYNKTPTYSELFVPFTIYDGFRQISAGYPKGGIIVFDL